MKKTAFLFPGQGSQKVGMGQDLVQEHEVAAEIFTRADDITGMPISKLCFEGPMEALTQTVNLQPAVTTVNLALLAVVQNAGIQPTISAGHSLGEFSALSAAGVITPDECISLVYKRGALMHRESMVHNGAMSAVLGLSIDQVTGIVAEASASGVVAVANHNSTEQIVITGTQEGVAAAGQLAAAQGARAIPLRVSGAWHSPLIQGAEAEFKSFLERFDLRTPRLEVVHNVTAAPETDPATIRSLLARQLCSPVRWYESINHMLAQQVELFVEIGPGRVLSGLLKKILPKESGARIFNVYDLKTLHKFLEAQN